MAVVYAAALRTTRMNDVKTAIDAGAAAGTLEVCSAAYAAVLSSHTLSDPCGSVSGDVLTFDAIADDTSANNTGTAAIARIKDSDANIIVSGLTVGTSGTNIVLNSTSITAGQTVEITAGSLTHNTSGT